MQDLETRSLWSQVTGECIQGEMESTTLPIYPSAIMTFGEFSTRHPDGKLLAKAEPGPDISPYEWYAADSTTLSMFGRADDFERLRGKEIVYGIRWKGHRAAVAKKFLTRERQVTLMQFNPPVVIIADSIGNSVVAFELPGDCPGSSPVVDDSIITSGDGSRSWNAWTGRILSGDGSDLMPVPITAAYWFAWVSFFPNTVLVK